MSEVSAGDIVSHNEMCARERRMLQHGMNFRTATQGSVLLMSRRLGAPYHDRVLDDGQVLIYEGHDVPRRKGISDPKLLDQPRTTPSGRLTPNGKFAKAAEEFRSGRAPAELVRVYEKIKAGIWTFNGVFQLVDATTVQSGNRSVFKFRLEVCEPDITLSAEFASRSPEHSRLIPSVIKQEVWKRDGGACVLCGRRDDLHFDHDLPFSKGGTSLQADNIRLLCARHNLSKGAKIE